jgi:hypothetical protein
MSKSNSIMVWSIATTVSLFLSHHLFTNLIHRVNWNALYDEDYYKKQEEIYKKIRPTLLSNTLVIPTERIREHIQQLSYNNYLGIQSQIEAFNRTNKKPPR